MEVTSAGSTGDQVMLELDEALRKVGVKSWFSRIVGGCVDGAELRKLRYKFVDKVACMHVGNLISEEFPLAVVLC